MTENMPVIAEVWPVTADPLGIWLISGDDAWRTAPVPSDSGPHFELDLELFGRGLRDRVTLMHSTSWRADGPHLIVTYMAVIAADDFVRGTWPGALPVTARLLDVVGRPPGHAATSAPEPRYIDVLTHGLRHLRFLLDYDATACAALGELWRRHLARLTPALAGMYSGPHRPLTLA